MSATVLAIQVGKPAVHGADIISDKEWESGIFKAGVDGRVWLDTLNLEGDGQSDLKNHGGPFRAVLAYSADHYPVWQRDFGREFSFGSFGENFTVSGLDESTVCLGDIYQVGDVRLQVAQPRYPCWKLSRRNGLKTLAAKVEERGWGGWYHQVLQTGYVQAGDSYTLLERPYSRFTIELLFDLMTERLVDKALYAELAGLEVLSTSWRQNFAGRA